MTRRAMALRRPFTATYGLAFGATRRFQRRALCQGPPDLIAPVGSGQRRGTSRAFGFYVRQNGGALTQTSTPGQGYALYVEGGFARAIGVWRETNGVEEVLANTTDPIGAGLSDGVRYRIRFQCQQAGDATALRLKLWPESESEPTAWHLEHTDGTPELQNTAGSFAVDLYNYAGTGSLYIDDVQITPL